MHTLRHQHGSERKALSFAWGVSDFFFHFRRCWTETSLSNKFWCRKHQHSAHTANELMFRFCPSIPIIPRCSACKWIGDVLWLKGRSFSIVKLNRSAVNDWICEALLLLLDLHVTACAREIITSLTCSGRPWSWALLTMISGSRSGCVETHRYLEVFLAILILSNFTLEKKKQSEKRNVSQCFFLIKIF